MDTGERLREAISTKFLSLKDFSAASGVNYRTLQHYLSGQRSVSTDFLVTLTNILGVSASWILTGFGPMFLTEGERIGRSPAALPDIVHVPLYAVEASAGHGRLAEDDATTGFYAFNRKWLARRGLNPNRLAVISVRGDSMEPSFSDKDLVLIDQDQSHPTDGLIYVFRVEEDLFIKHVQTLPDGTLRLLSANKIYPPLPVNPRSAPEGFQVIGRVVASMHEW